MPDHRDACAADLGETFRAEAAALYRLAKRLLGDGTEAEDAVQDAFLRLTRRGGRASRLIDARAFVFRVVRNVCIDRLRARARQTMVLSEDGCVDDRRSGWAAATPETDVLVAKSFRRIAEAMRALPDIEAEALSLVVVEGLSYREVAAATDVPIGTVRSRLNRARRTLRAALQETSSPSPLAPETPSVVGLPRKIG